jgi:hypothetical protein
MTVLCYTVPGAPVSTNHGYKPARWGNRHGMVLTPEGEAYKGLLLFYARKAWMRAGRPCLESADVTVRFVFKTRRSDADGPVKFVLDSLQAAGFVKNDSRVRRITVEKLEPDGKPRTEIEVREFAGRESV